MKMNRILNVGADTLTVEAGATHLDMAEELQKRNLQFYVNTEIGSLSAGSAACAGEWANKRSNDSSNRELRTQSGVRGIGTRNMVWTSFDCRACLQRAERSWLRASWPRIGSGMRNFKSSESAVVRWATNAGEPAEVSHA